MQPTVATDRVVIDQIKGRDRKTLETLLADRAKWRRIGKEADENSKACSELLLPILTRLGIRNILASDDLGTTMQFILVSTNSRHLSRGKLIDAGVDPDIIEECTEVTPYQTIQVRGIKEKE